MSRHLDDKIRAECLSFMLNWQGPQLADGVRETAELDAQDVVSGPPPFTPLFTMIYLIIVVCRKRTLLCIMLLLRD